MCSIVVRKFQTLAQYIYLYKGDLRSTHNSNSDKFINLRMQGNKKDLEKLVTSTFHLQSPILGLHVSLDSKCMSDKKQVLPFC